MIKVLEEYYQQKKAISIYTDEEDTFFRLTGYITSMNDDEILISHMNSRGEYDGYILKQVKEVYQVECESVHEKKIEKLYILKSQRHPELKISEKSIFFSLLKHAKENDYIVRLELKDTQFFGYIKKYDDDMVYLNCVDQYGRDDGEVSIKIDEIQTVWCDTDTEQDIRMIHKSNLTDI